MFFSDSFASWGKASLQEIQAKTLPNAVFCSIETQHPLNMINCKSRPAICTVSRLKCQIGTCFTCPLGGGADTPFARGRGQTFEDTRGGGSELPSGREHSGKIRARNLPKIEKIRVENLREDLSTFRQFETLEKLKHHSRPERSGRVGWGHA